MSYVALKPSYYQILNPEGAWHPGAEGWSVAPYPGWGENTALVGPKQLAIHGLGMESSMNSDQADCGADRRTGLVIGIGIGGAMASLAAFLLTR